MKRAFLFLAVMCIIIPFCACSDTDDDNVGIAEKPALVKQITRTMESYSKYGSVTRLRTVTNIEYDNRNRISRITEIYNNQEPKEYLYTYLNNTLTITFFGEDEYSNPCKYSIKCKLNADGYVETSSNPYEDEGFCYFYSYDNGYLQRTYSNFYNGQITNFPNYVTTYTWENGNLVSTKRRGESPEWTISYSQYDAAPINFCVEYLVVGTYIHEWLSFWGFTGKHCDLLPIEGIVTQDIENGPSSKTTLSYRFNNNKTISEISMETSYDDGSYHSYEDLVFVY